MARSKIGGRGSARGARNTQRGRQRMLARNKNAQARDRRRLGSFRTKP